MPGKVISARRASVLETMITGAISLAWNWSPVPLLPMQRDRIKLQ
jgi:hypothetical protein